MGSYCWPLGQDAQGLGVAAASLPMAHSEKLAYYLSLGHRDEELLLPIWLLRINRLRSLKRRWGPCKMDFQLTRVWMLLKNGKRAIRYQFADGNAHSGSLSFKLSAM